MGKAEGENEIAVKDAYFQYKGLDNVKVTVGNANFPFSREFLTSSKYQQLVERTFVGDHNYGTPDRNVGVHLTGNSESKEITWGASGAIASIDPDVKNWISIRRSIPMTISMKVLWLVAVLIFILSAT